MATIEYVGTVGLVAAVLGGATAVAAPDLPGTLARQMRVAVCIVGGDVCRESDAKRAGLEPCVVSAREAARRSRVTFATLSYGTGKSMAIERRSDGTARVSIASDDDGGVEVGVGVKLGKHADAGADLSGTVGFTSGYAWELADERALRRFLDGVSQSPGRLGWDLMRKGRLTAPAERFRAVTGSAAGGAAAEILGLDRPLASGTGRAAIGRRTRAGRTSWYFDATSAGPHLFSDGGEGGAWAIELSAGELRITSALPGHVEIDARLDLGDPANRAVARQLLEHPSPARARALGRHIAEHGTVERRRYRVRELPSDPEIGVKLGLAGVDHGGDARERTLVFAEVLTPAGNARRADCLGL